MATVTAAQAERGAQTIEGFVNEALDNAKVSPLYRRVIALIAAGYFCDVIDYTIYGSLVPFIIKSGFGAADAAFIGSATIVGLAIGTAGQGQFSDRFGRRFVYQFNLLFFGIFTILGALSPNVILLVICRFIAGIFLGAEQPLAFAYAGEWSPKRIRGRALAIVHFIGGACVWPIGTGLVLLFAAIFAASGTDPVAAGHVWRGVWILVGVLALIVWVFRFTLPESPRYLATHGRGNDALDTLVRLGIARPTQPLSTDVASDIKSDPFAVVFKMFRKRVIAGMICFTAFFGIAIGLGAWLPNIMNAKGFSITKSLQYLLAMNFAVPCASIFMMYALDKFGRKITSVCTFVGAGVMAIVFANAQTPIELMVIGFIMTFFVQVAGNAMQIFASEVFPTNARASGFGWASGVGRLATAVIMPTILWVQNGFGLTTVFVSLAVLLFIAAVSVTQMGPEAKQKSLDEVEPPTSKLIEAGNIFWLRFSGALLVGLSFFWWTYFYINVLHNPENALPCLLYTTGRCQIAVGAAELAGQWAYRPYFLWVGVAIIVATFFVTASRTSSSKKAEGTS
jgi:MFS transporter, putative metabolite:H+ symporter